MRAALSSLALLLLLAGACVREKPVSRVERIVTVTWYRLHSPDGSACRVSGVLDTGSAGFPKTATCNWNWTGP